MELVNKNNKIGLIRKNLLNALVICISLVIFSPAQIKVEEIDENRIIRFDELNIKGDQL